MTFQVFGAGMISLGVAAGVACIFRAGLMILMAATVNDEIGEKWQRQWKQ
jgi:hypothetical protein